MLFVGPAARVRAVGSPTPFHTSYPEHRPSTRWATARLVQPTELEMYGGDAVWRVMRSGFSMIEAGLRFSEMITASNSVIQARMAIIGAATRNPLDGDYDELGRMLPEKLAGFSEAGMAVAQQWWAAQRDAGEHFRELGMMLLGPPPSPLAAFAAAEGMADFNVRAVTRAMETSGVAIEPLHERATANARRLEDPSVKPKSVRTRHLRG